MNILLIRYRFKNEIINGHISIDGTRICDTLENAMFHVPPGKYDIQIIHLPQWGRKMPTLNGSAVIGIGNGVHNRTDHRILVGTFNGIYSVIKSKPAFDTLYERIRKTIERGNQVQLIIKESLQ